MPDARMEEVLGYFQEAAEQRVDVDLFFMLDRCQFSHLRVPLVRVKNGFFVVLAKMELLDAQPVIWGADVSGYFTLRLERMVPCHFRSRLSRIYNGPLDSMYLVFPLPASIDHNQMRFSRRVSMNEETASSFGIWHGEMEGGDETTLPALKWQPLLEEYCELAELSASGMRLDLPDHSHLCTRLNLNDPVLLKGDFGAPGKPSKVFVLGSIVRKMPRIDEEGVMGVGCHFFSWRKLDGRTWFRIDPQEGLAAIAQWLSRNFRALN